MNVNRGASILIRLRPPNDETIFLPWESLLGTMIHELTHMAIGPHSAEFYKLMDQLYDEVENDAGSKGTEKYGATGAMFMGNYKTLGGKEPFNSSGKVAGVSRDVVAAAAIKRQQLGILQGSSSSGGHRLGGCITAPVNNSERRNIFSSAIERRLRDEGSCHQSESNENYVLYLGNDNEVENNQPTSNNNHNRNDNSSKIETLLWYCDQCGWPNYDDSTSCVYCISPQSLGETGNNIGSAFSNHDILIINDDIKVGRANNKAVIDISSDYDLNNQEDSIFCNCGRLHDQYCHESKRRRHLSVLSSSSNDQIVKISSSSDDQLINILNNDRNNLSYDKYHNIPSNQSIIKYQQEAKLYENNIKENIDYDVLTSDNHRKLVNNMNGNSFGVKNVPNNSNIFDLTLSDSD